MSRRGTRYAVYLLTGPSGVYVGMTAAPSTRKESHFANASASARPGDLRLYAAMRADGPATYRFRVIARVDGGVAARKLELETIERLRAEGRSVLNRYPLTAGQRRIRRERTANMRPENVAFADYVRSLRIALGISSAELARRVGVSAGQVSRWENGLCKANDRVQELARELGVPLNEFIERAYSTPVLHGPSDGGGSVLPGKGVIGPASMPAPVLSAEGSR